MDESQSRHYTWTCPVCECGNGWGLVSCEGFGEQTHPIVWLSDVHHLLSARAKELEAALRDANACIDELQGRLSDTLDERDRLALGQEAEARHMRERGDDAGEA